jgi:hypothetical protein
MIADALRGSKILKTFGASHDNVVSFNTNHSAGPTGNELTMRIWLL